MKIANIELEKIPPEEPWQYNISLNRCKSSVQRARKSRHELIIMVGYMYEYGDTSAVTMYPWSRKSLSPPTTKKLSMIKGG